MLLSETEKKSKGEGCPFVNLLYALEWKKCTWVRIKDGETAGSALYRMPLNQPKHVSV